MANREFAIFGAGMIGVVLMGPGCRFTEPNPAHCFNNDGDAYCAARDPSRPYCERGQDACISPDNDHGCVASRPIDACYSPCGGRSTLAENGECVAAESSSGSSSGGTQTGTDTGTETGSSSSTTGPQPCMSNEDCTDPTLPYCADDGLCAGCGDAPQPAGNQACMTADAQRPLCDEGVCVACVVGLDTTVCDQQLLVCDDLTHSCVDCTQHDQCGAGACDVADGRCFDPDNVLHVGMDQTYQTITAALDDVGAMLLDPAVLVLHQGSSFDETATVSSGTLAFVAAEGEQPQWVNTSLMEPTLTATGAQTRVYLDQLRLTGNLNDLGLVCDDGPRFDVRRSRIVNNTGGGVLATNGCQLHIENSFVGGDVSDTNAMEINGGIATISYSTLGAGFGSATALTCNAMATVEVRNSLLIARAGGDELSCSGAFDFNATETDLGGTNTTLGEMTDTSWFMGFAMGNFALSGTQPSPLATAAQWQDGDPVVDIDGDPRPTVDGTRDYAGADAVP